MKLIQNRLVQDPSMSDAEFLHQKAIAPHKPNVGQVYVQENAVTRIGALAFVRRRLRHHEKAAEWFKSAYEALYGGCAPAIDMAKVRVDTSIMAHDSGAVDRLDRGKGLVRAMEYLGAADRDRIIACVVLCVRCADNADTLPSGKPNRRAVIREVDALLDALDKLAVHLGYKTRGAA